MQYDGFDNNQSEVLRRGLKGYIRFFPPLASAEMVDAADALVKSGHLERRHRPWYLPFFTYEIKPETRKLLEKQ